MRDFESYDEWMRITQVLWVLIRFFQDQILHHYHQDFLRDNQWDTLSCVPRIAFSQASLLHFAFFLHGVSRISQDQILLEDIWYQRMALIIVRFEAPCQSMTMDSKGVRVRFEVNILGVLQERIDRHHNHQNPSERYELSHVYSNGK